MWSYPLLRCFPPINLTNQSLLWKDGSIQHLRPKQGIFSFLSLTLHLARRICHTILNLIWCTIRSLKSIVGFKRKSNQPDKVNWVCFGWVFNATHRLCAYSRNTKRLSRSFVSRSYNFRFLVTFFFNIYSLINHTIFIFKHRPILFFFSIVRFQTQISLGNRPRYEKSM